MFSPQFIAVALLTIFVWLLFGTLHNGPRDTAPVVRHPATTYCPSKSLNGLFVPCRYVWHPEIPV